MYEPDGVFGGVGQLTVSTWSPITPPTLVSTYECFPSPAESLQVYEGDASAVALKGDFDGATMTITTKSNNEVHLVAVGVTVTGYADAYRYILGNGMKSREKESYLEDHDVLRGLPQGIN